MKAMAVLLLVLLPVLSHADVILDNPPPAKPPVKRKRPAPVKTDTKTETTATTATTSVTTTTAATTTVATTTTAAPVPATTTTAAPAPTVPEPRRSKFPFGALTAVGIAVIVAITASRRKRQGQ